MNHRDNPLACWLVTRAARHAPPELAARLEEEWLADLNARRSALAKIGFALGCSWATQVIAHDSLVLGASARGLLGAQGTLAAFAPAELSPGAGRSTVVMLVLALHAVVIYAFLTGIIHVLPKAPPEVVPAVVHNVPADHTPLTLPPGPIVTLTTLAPPSPPDGPVINIQQLPSQGIPDPGPTNVGTGGDPQHSIVRMLGGPGVGFPNTDVFYPAASRRAEESGAVGVRVCVDERGRLVGDPEIASTSGSVRLDQGALALARAGSGHYRSTTEDGKAVSSCYAYRVRFQMR